MLNRIQALHLLGLVALSITFLGTRANAQVVDDPSAALKLYDGKWDSTTTIGDKEVIRLENHCTRTGQFFVCEQMVDGKTVGLTVFLPVSRIATGGEEYKTTGISPDEGPPGSWNKLTIEGDRWTYFWENTTQAGKVYWRNVNQFSGPGKIHFEIQRSDDGKIWKTKKGGDETRLP